LELALFDLDNTLLAGDSDYEWAQFLVEVGALDRAEHETRNREFYEHYKRGTLDIGAFLDFQLAPLAQHPRAVLDDWHMRFMRDKVLPMIRPAGRVLIERHRAQGALCAIVTATNSFVTEPIARELGVEHLIATEPEVRDGEFTGRVSGVPCFREGKVTRVGQWLASLDRDWSSFAASWFYSDSLNDLPLLEHVTQPVAVDPDETLATTALRRGWPVISLGPA
jgi:HAD superfamily hydrolase (TIGR01490 family)